jgi:hypothetical protein
MAKIITTRDLKPNEYLEFPIFLSGEETVMVDPAHPDFENYKLNAQLLKKSLEERLKKLKSDVSQKWSQLDA